MESQITERKLKTKEALDRWIEEQAKEREQRRARLRAQMDKRKEQEEEEMERFKVFKRKQHIIVFIRLIIYIG